MACVLLLAHAICERRELVRPVSHTIGGIVRLLAANSWNRKQTLVGGQKPWTRLWPAPVRTLTHNSRVPFWKFAKRCALLTGRKLVFETCSAGSQKSSNSMTRTVIAVHNLVQAV